MLKIDTHQHFWKYDPNKDGWITDDMSLLQKDFLPDDIYPVLIHNQITGCVAVQADQSATETAFLLDLAGRSHFIKGVIGWVDLKDGSLSDKLEFYKGFKKLKGFRHVLQAEKDPKFMISKQFYHGISLLGSFDFTFDLLLTPGQLPFAKKLVGDFPNQRFILNHLGKPYIKDKALAEWSKDIEELAKLENVCCKVSGLLTQAGWYCWKAEDIFPYIDVAVNAFGVERLMFGSDWPVCTLAGGYNNYLTLLNNYFEQFSLADQAKFWGENACSYYDITDDTI